MRWNEVFIAGAKKQTPPPALLARNLAILHLACWRALKAVPEDAATDPIAFSAAAHRVCVILFPSQSADFEKVATSTGLDRSANQAIINAAEAAADSVLNARRADGSSSRIDYNPRADAGQWRRTGANRRPPELPNWPMVVPFVLERADQFRPPPPPDITSPEFKEAVDEVHRLGGAESTERTAEQTLIARFWSDFSYTTSPPGHWNDIARDLIAEKQLSVRRSAELFAILNVAMADAGIAAWECKYHYNFWRPVTALTRPPADARNNGSIWQPLLNTPPHPEYVSGHAAFSGAAVVVLEQFFGKEVEFSAGSDTLKDQHRKFSSFRQCAGEISASRVYGGIHYRFSGRAGIALGSSVATFALQKWQTSEGIIPLAQAGNQSKR